MYHDQPLGISALLQGLQLLCPAARKAQTACFSLIACLGFGVGTLRLCYMRARLVVGSFHPQGV